MPGTMLLGYDVECQDDTEGITRRFLERARQLHNRLNVPATLFVVGRTLEQNVSEFQAIAQDPLFDLQQHTYSHCLLKTVHIDDGKTVRVVPGVDLPEARSEVRRASESLKEHLGVDCLGLTGPWAYYRGLRDRPDLVKMVWNEGIRFVRTDGRNEKGWHPVSLDLQPYWYDEVEFSQPGNDEPPPSAIPAVLEIPIHSWHDNVLRGEVLGWENLDAWVESITPYIDRAAAEDLVFSYCQHDHSSIREDPEMSATARHLEYALEKGLRIMTCRAYYEEGKSTAARLDGAHPNPPTGATI